MHGGNRCTQIRIQIQIKKCIYRFTYVCRYRYKDIHTYTFFKGFDICLAPCLGYVQCQVLQFCQLTIHLSQLRLSTSSANSIENTPSLHKIENKKQTQGYMHIRTLDCWLCTLCVFFLFFVWFQFFCSAILLYDKK